MSLLPLPSLKQKTNKLVHGGGVEFAYYTFTTFYPIAILYVAILL